MKKNKNLTTFAFEKHFWKQNLRYAVINNTWKIEIKRLFEKFFFSLRVFPNTSICCYKNSYLPQADRKTCLFLHFGTIYIVFIFFTEFAKKRKKRILSDVYL